MTATISKLLSVSAAAFVAVSVCAANIADEPAPPSRATPPAEPRVAVTPPGHGWICLVDDPVAEPRSPGIMLSPGKGTGEGSVMIHLPPRGGGGATSTGEVGGTIAAARLAPGFPQPAERMAWWNDRVYVALKDERLMATEHGDWQRRILGITAAPATIGSLSVGGGQSGVTAWEYPPNRPELIGTLPGKIELTGFGACSLGPVALTRTGRVRTTMGAGASASSSVLGPMLELSVCISATWRPVLLPWAGGDGVTPATPGSSARYWVLSPREAGVIALAVLNNQSDDTITIWEATVPEPKPVSKPVDATITAQPPNTPNAKKTMAPKTRTPSPLDVVWKGRMVSLRVAGTPASGAAESEVFPIPDNVAALDGNIIAVAWEARSERDELGRVRMASLRADRADEFAPATDLPRSYTFVPMDGGLFGGGGRAVLVWTAGRDAASGNETGSGGGERIREVSAASGRVLYEGAFRPKSWISLAQYRVMAITMVAIMAAVLMFVLRRGPAKGKDGGAKG